MEGWREVFLISPTTFMLLWAVPIVVLPLGILTAGTPVAGCDVSPHHGVPTIPTSGCPLRKFCATSSTGQAGAWDTLASAALVVSGYSAVESCAASDCWHPCHTDLPWTYTCPLPLLRLDIKKNYFMVGMVRHKDRLPRDAVDDPSVKTFEVSLGRALSNLM